MADHRYNDPSLTPLQFLRAVYSDPTVSMYLRTKAAEAAAPYESRPVFQEREHWPGEPAITITIQGIANNPPELIGPEPKVH
jgi:hypothetical protein